LALKLIEAIKELWAQARSLDFLQKLRVSMLRRLQIAIEAQGEAIKY
jgi:hypothetical protein